MSFEDCIRRAKASKRRLLADTKPGSIPDRVTVINKIILKPGEYRITIIRKPLKGKKGRKNYN